MAAEAEGTRIAKAKVIEAEGEIKAAQNLLLASNIIMEDPHIMRVNNIYVRSYFSFIEEYRDYGNDFLRSTDFYKIKNNTNNSV